MTGDTDDGPDPAQSSQPKAPDGSQSDDDPAQVRTGGHGGPPDHGDPAAHADPGTHPEPGSPPGGGGQQETAAEAGAGDLARQGNDTVQTAIRVLENAVAQREAITKGLEEQKAAVRQAVAAQKAAAMLQLIGSLDYLQSNTATSQPTMSSDGAAAPAAQPESKGKPGPTGGDASQADPASEAGGEESSQQVLDQVTAILESLVEKEMDTRIDALHRELGLGPAGPGDDGKSAGNSGRT